MKKNKENRELVPVLWYLYDIETLDEAIFTNESSEYIKNSYSLEERKEIYKAIKWAAINPNFHFESILEGTPVSGKLKFNNEEVYQYLMLFKCFLENEEYGLLTDDRPTNLPWERE